MGSTQTPTRLIGTEKLKAQLAEKLPISTVATDLCGLEIEASGNQYKALCPFHGEDTPSFYLNDAKGVFHCFGCKEGGDYIDLVQKTRLVEYYEALYVLAAEAGVDIEQYERPLTEEERRKERLRQDCEQWIQQLPLATERVRDAPTSMAPRVVADQPEFLRTLPSYLFRGVLFPMRLASGALVGWKCRTADKAMFATPREFPLSERTLFGIDVARQYIRSRGEVILVEGEYDCIAMHNAGFSNTVAIGGTTFNEGQMEMLQSLRVPRAVFAFDGDVAGQQASRSIAERWWDGEVQVNVATLPDGQDPEDMLKRDTLGGEHMNGLELASVIDRAKWALEHVLFDEWSRRGDGIGDKLEFLEWIQERFGRSFTSVQEVVVGQHVAGWLNLPDAQVLDFGRANQSKLQATDSEQIVMGRCLRDKDYYRAVRKKLDITDFYMVRHQRLWKVLQGFLVEDLDFELVSIKQRAASNGVDEAYIDLLIDTGEGNIAYHEDKVADLSVRRSAKDSADRFRERIGDTSINAIDVIGDLTLGITKKTLGSQRITPISEQVDRAMDTLHERMKNPDGVHGLDLGTQFPVLTKKLQGLQHRRLVLVAATSGVGKTTIVLQRIISLAVYQSVPCDFISLEMDEEEMIFKAASHLTGIDCEKITGGSLESWEAVLVEQALARIRKAPLRLYAPDDITPSEFVLYARESVMEHRTEVFVLDYAQLVSPEIGSEGKKTHEQLKEFGRVAKMQVARGMNTCVICPAQLTRASAERERPTKEDMGDCYDLTRTADVVVILKDYEGSDTIDCWLDKNRQGSGGHLIGMEFAKTEQTFYEHGGEAKPDYRLMAS
jgi:DNA primase